LHKYKILAEGGCINELVARRPTVKKVRGWISLPTNVSLEHWLFKLITDKKYQVIHMFNMVLILQITSIGFNLLRSARTLNHLTDHRKASRLDQLVTIQHVAINNHGQRFTTQHPSTIDHRPITINHSSSWQVLYSNLILIALLD
jgi:hypothetical protein